MVSLNQQFPIVTFMPLSKGFSLHNHKEIDKRYTYCPALLPTEDLLHISDLAHDTLYLPRS